MNHNETLKPHELLSRSSRKDEGEEARLDPREVELVTRARGAMLDSIRGELSPLMRRAVGIKLEGEQHAFASLMREEQQIEEERTRRRGVLDARFFRKRRLPAHH